MTDVVITAATRTPIGSFQGALSGVSAPELGAAAIRAAVGKSGTTAESVDEVYMGNVLNAGVGQAPARQAAIAAGLPNHVPATTVSKVCGSGLQAVILGAKSILLGDASVVVAGGMENMSQSPYLLPKARAGYRMGNGEIIDSMVHDGLWDPYNNFHMGKAAELCSTEHKLTREAQDAFAKQSYERAQAAQADGKFTAELTAVTIKGRKGDTVVDTDEEPGRARFDKIPQLRPAFDKEGTITAANASKINDGASALVLMSAEKAKELGAPVLAKIVSYAGHAQEPKWFTTAPIEAMKKAAQKAGVGFGDVDLFEINEAFACVTMAAAQSLDIPADKVNVHGGAVALGHPIGASGARILTTLVHAMADRGAKRGATGICIGGGEALSLIVERP